ncbi:hypothetical protein ACNQKP_10610 [Bdellovibrio bacteriovorus]|uniref:hypothetical protein n=1 Tax=Bdellovibrio bacteriovorus TaxID=959 RepID=UPI003AA835E3
MNKEERSTDLNSTENRKKPFIAIDRIDISIHRKAGKGYHDIKKPQLTTSILERIHKKAYYLSASGVFLGRGKGSGFTNGTKLFFHYLGLKYEGQGKKSKYFNTKNQIPDNLLIKAHEIETRIPFPTFQLDLCENLLVDIRNNLDDSLPKGEIEFRCSGLEVYFEIPKNAEIEKVRERIYEYLSTTFTSVPTTRSPQLGQNGPLQEWSIYLKEYSYKIPARLTTYSKGDRTRIELKIDNIPCRSSTTSDLISSLKRYATEASEILTKVSIAIEDLQFTQCLYNFDNKIFTRQVLGLINGKTTLSSIGLFCEQIQKDGYVFMPKSQAQYKSYKYFLNRLRQLGIISTIKGTSLDGSTIQVSSKKKGLYQLDPNWQKTLKNAVKAKRRNIRKQKVVNKAATQRSSNSKIHIITQSLLNQIATMPLSQQSKILSILTATHIPTTINYSYPKTVAEYLDLHSPNMYRLQNSFPKNKPNL